MMYDVRWVRSAENALTDVWTRAEDRSAVTLAVQRIDEALAVTPEDVGESRDAGRRILIMPPLGVIFLVDTHRRNVLVSHVWSFKTPGTSSS
jgi:plasmid stabilization system protein ParE